MFSTGELQPEGNYNLLSDFNLTPALRGQNLSVIHSEIAVTLSNGDFGLLFYADRGRVQSSLKHEGV